MTEESTSGHQNPIIKWLASLQNITLDGFKGFDSSEAIAKAFMKPGKSKTQQITSLIAWQAARAGSVGALTGLGGFIALPITLPADIAGVMLIQVRMVQAIALICGHDPRDDRVKTFVLLTLLGGSATEVLKELGINVAKDIVAQALMRLATEAIAKLVTQRLITQAAAKSLTSTVGRLIPLLGAAVGGTIDYASTRIVGRVARQVFWDESQPPQGS